MDLIKRHLDGYIGREPSAHIRASLAHRMKHVQTDFPIFRLVWSEQVMGYIGGEWSDWDEGVALDDRGSISPILGADGQPMMSARPIRTVTELRLVPKYTELDPPGWVLERWFPPHMFGSPEWWASQVVEGTTIPRLGPYPSRGAYQMLTGPFPLEPSIDFLNDFISHHEQVTSERLAQDIGTHIRLKVEAAVKKDQERVARSTAEVRARLLDRTRFVNSASLEAGRLRNKAAERAGIRSHVGN